MEGFKGYLQQDTHGREAAQDQLFRRSGVLSGRLVRGVEKRPRRQGVRRWTEIKRGYHPRCGRMDGRGQGDMNVAAVVVVMAERRLSAFIGDGDVDGGVGGRIVGGVMAVAVFRGMIVGQIRRVLEGDAGELKTVLDAVLAIDHAMHLHRDHDGHAQADAKEAEQAWQIEIPRSNFVSGKSSAMQRCEGRRRS
ncbi:hypothetical protein [Brevundimonas sp.]|uniref:hypothetical protein n=1 Tax=Brevundimonas sp. TaxID=1871086 RepID=UPI002ED8CB23